MKIPELVYEVRNLARKEEDPVKKDLLFQSAKAMEILGNLAKVSDLVVAEYKSANKPSKTENDEIDNYNICETSLQMLEDHLNQLLWYKFIEKDDRWPYGNDNILIFTPFYKPIYTVKDSKTE
jgi:hypothetical protein